MPAFPNLPVRGVDGQEWILGAVALSSFGVTSFPLCTDVRLLLVDQGSHLPETSPAEREALQPESFLLGLIRLTSGVGLHSLPCSGLSGPLAPRSGTSSSLLTDPECSLCSPEAVLLRTKALLSSKVWIGRQDEPDVCKAIGAF